MIKNAEDSKLAEEAFKVIDLLRTYIKNNYQDVNDIFRALNISKPIIVKMKRKDSANPSGMTEINQNVNIDSIKNINRYGMENYDMRLEKIDKLIVVISKKISRILWSDFTILKQEELEKIAKLKIMDIMKWKENVYKAMSKKTERYELGMQAQNIELQKLKLNNLFINFQNLPNLFIPPKFTKLNKKLEKKHAEIDSTYNKEYALINSPNNRPSYVYNNKWQHWHNLFYTKHFFMAIDDMETFNLSDEQTIRLNKFYYGTVKI
uniref:Uncharacterized protein n=1 Tax=Globodera rostochiensis TaxID=31243 RepID=A0A914I1L8_GLORO